MSGRTVRAFRLITAVWLTFVLAVAVGITFAPHRTWEMLFLWCWTVPASAGLAAFWWSRVPVA